MTTASPGAITSPRPPRIAVKSKFTHTYERFFAVSSQGGEKTADFRARIPLTSEISTTFGTAYGSWTLMNSFLQRR